MNTKTSLVLLMPIILTACANDRRVLIDLGALSEPGFDRDIRVTVQLDDQIVMNNTIPAKSSIAFTSGGKYTPQGYKAKITYAFVDDPASANSVEFLADTPYPNRYLVLAVNKNGAIELHCQGQFFPKELQGICAPAKVK